jgi:hypothetical protein
MEQILVDHWRFVFGALAAVLLVGTILGLAGRKVLKKLLENGGGPLGCPLADKGKTPLSREEHTEICQREQRIVLGEIKHVKETVDLIWQKLS